ncbi:hypothetical protein KCTC52924_00946 [Arenibacter antarcticus]
MKRTLIGVLFSMHCIKTGNKYEMSMTEIWSQIRMKICEPDCRQASSHTRAERSRSMTVKKQ